MPEVVVGEVSEPLGELAKPPRLYLWERRFGGIRYWVEVFERDTEHPRR